jgi:hypothetical protein
VSCPLYLFFSILQKHYLNKCKYFSKICHERKYQRLLSGGSTVAATLEVYTISILVLWMGVYLKSYNNSMLAPSDMMSAVCTYYSAYLQLSLYLESFSSIYNLSTPYTIVTRVPFNLELG